MHSNHYSQTVSLKIYALILGRYVYVGKSKSPSLASAYSRHIHGYCVVTEDYFASEGKKRPKLFLLEHAHMTQSIGYRYILAYIHLFQANGYVILNHERSIEQSETMDLVTEGLYRSICEKPLDAILRTGYLPKPSMQIDDIVAQPVVTVSKQKELSWEHLCIRLTEDEKLKFQQLANTLNLSQRDLVIFLMNCQSEKTLVTEDLRLEHYIPRVISAFESKLAAKDKDIEKLKKLVVELRPGERGLERKNRITLIQRGLHQFFDFATVSTEQPSLPRGKYRHFSRSLPKERQYRYPEKEGFMVFRPEYILWGQSSTPVCFILGVGEDDVPCKLRYYDKHYYVGPRITDKAYGYQGSTWIVGFEQAADGAMDIILSLPLDVLFAPTEHLSSSEHEKDTLDAIIAEAERKKITT